MNTGRTFRLGYSSITWGREPDLDEMLGAISGAGWEGVEFIPVSLDWLGTPARLKGVLDRYGLPAVCMFGNVSIEGDLAKALEKQRRIIEYTAELGGSVFCVLGPTRTPLRLPTEDEFQRAAEFCEKLIDHAEPLGIAVAYHAHPLCAVESEAELDRLLSHTDRLKVCVDVSISEKMGEDPNAQFRKYRERLAYVHMKDVGHTKFCIMGTGIGSLDFGQIRETLNEIGYDGWVMGEMSSYADTPAAESCYQNMAFLKSVGY